MLRSLVAMRSVKASPIANNAEALRVRLVPAAVPAGPGFGEPAANAVQAIRIEHRCLAQTPLAQACGFRSTFWRITYVLMTWDLSVRASQVD